MVSASCSSVPLLRHTRRMTSSQPWKAAVKSAQSAGDNAWMLVSAALVLMMTGPGLALVLWRPGAQKERARHDDAELSY